VLKKCNFILMCSTNSVKFNLISAHNADDVLELRGNKEGITVLYGWWKDVRG
jgi:hypothetical protein